MTNIDASNSGIPQSFPTTEAGQTEQAGTAELIFNRDLPHSLFPDGVSVSSGIEVKGEYTDPSSAPMLPQPKGKEADAENFFNKMFASYEPSPEMTEQLDEYFRGAIKDVKKKLGDDQSYVPNKKEGSTLYSRFFESALQQNVKAEDRAAVRYAFYNPDRAKGLTSEQKQQLKKTQLAAKGELRSGFNTPADFEPEVDNFMYNTQLTLDYSDGYVSHLKNLKKEGEISGKLAKQLEALHYHPEFNYPNQKELEQAQQQIEGGFRQQFMQKNGLPENWTPPVETIPFDARADGLFRDFFEEKLLQSQELSKNEKREAFMALAGPAKAGGRAKKAASKIEAEATRAVQKEMELPETWGPKEKRVEGDITPQQRRVARNGIQYIRESLEAAENNVKAMPPEDPNRPVLLQYLKVVGEALDILMQMLYQIEGSNSKASKLLSAMMQDMQLNKIESWRKEVMEYRKERDEAKEKAEEGKGGFFGGIQKVMKSLGPVSTVISAVTAVFTSGHMGRGPLIGMAIAGILVTEEFANKDLIAEAFKKLESTLDTLWPAELPPIMKKLMTIQLKMLFMITYLSAAAPAMGPFAVDYVMDTFEKSGIIENSVDAAGGDEEMQRKVARAVMIAMAVTVAVVMVIAGIAISIATAGAGSGAAVGAVTPAMNTAVTATQTSAQVASATAKASLQVAKSMKNVATQLGRIAVQSLKQAKQNIQQGIKMIKQGQKLVKQAAEMMKQAEKMDDAFQAQMALEKLRKGKELIQKGQDLVQKGQSTLAQIQDDAITASIDTSAVKPVNASQQATVAQNLQKAEKAINTAESIGQKQGIFQEASKFQKAAKTFEKAEKWGKRVGRVADFATGVAEGTQGIYTAVEAREKMKLYQQMAELTRLIAREQAYREEVDALIKMLKELITTLVTALGGLSEMIKDVNQLQSKKYENAGVIWAV